MTDKNMRRHTGNCYDCNGLLELVEIDSQKSTKIMVCQNCGLYHYYKKNFLGNYKLIKVSKIPGNGQESTQPPNR